MIGFLQECVRWFDHWLKGVDNGVMDEPKLLAWMQDGRPARGPPRGASGALGRRAGVAAAVGRRGARSSFDGRRPCTSQPRVGRPGRRAPGARTAGRATGRPTSAPRTAARCASRSRRWTSASRSSASPRSSSRCESTGRSALVAVRLCAVAPEGESLLVTRGLLNLTHRDSHEHIAPLEPGAPLRRPVRLDAIAHAIPAGHALRVGDLDRLLAVGVAVAGAGHADAPRRPPAAARAPSRATTRSRSSARPSRPSRRRSRCSSPAAPTAPTTHDIATGEHEIRFEWDVGGRRRLVEAGTEMYDTNVTTYRITDGDPLSAEVHVRCTTALGRGAWQTCVQTDSRMTRHGRRVPRHPARRRLRGRRALPLTHLGAALPPRRGVTSAPAAADRRERLRAAAGVPAVDRHDGRARHAHCDERRCPSEPDDARDVRTTLEELERVALGPYIRALRLLPIRPRPARR